MGRKNDVPFNPNNKWNMLITLTTSDINSDDGTITIPKELVETKILPWWNKDHCARLLEHNSHELVDLFEYETKITTTVFMKKAKDGDFKLHCWSSIPRSRKFKTGDIIGLWWDKNYARLNFELLLIANSNGRVFHNFL